MVARSRIARAKASAYSRVNSLQKTLKGVEKSLDGLHQKVSMFNQDIRKLQESRDGVLVKLEAATTSLDELRDLEADDGLSN